MKQQKASTYLALLVPVLALVVAGAVIAGGDPGSNGDLQEGGDGPGGGGECNCPQIYDPVICTQPSSGGPIISPNTAKKFSNACFAGCEGYTECRPAPAEVR